MSVRYSLVITIAALLLCTGCASPPSWTLQTPQSRSAIYAVASWPRTRFEQDARDKAMSQARAELAKTLRVDVKGVLVDWASSTNALGGQGHAEEFFASMDSETLDVSMSGSQIISVWCDRDGLVSEKGTWWALAKLDKSSLAEELRKTALAAQEKIKKELAAKAPDQQPAEIEAQARAAFDELDRRIQDMK